MRILHFYKTSFPESMGGVEQVINQIAIGAEKLGIHSDVLSLTDSRVPRTVELNGYHVHRARLNFQIASTGFSASVIFRFAELAKLADVIHYHFPWPFMDVVHFATRVKKPTVVTYHSDIVRQKNLLKLYRPLKLRFLGDVDHIVATSPNYLNSSSVLARFSEKVSTIPIGLDKSSYPALDADRVNHWRSVLGPKFFLFVGVLRYYKGLHILLEAIQGTNFPVVIVGAGPIEGELKAQALKLNLKNIFFLGQASDEDKVALFSICYGVVFPSHLRAEAFGISLLEGAMFGKAMISSEIGTGTTFINIPGETGLVVPPSDPSALRQAMEYFWENPEAVQEMGRRAEQRYWSLFTAEKMVADYVKVYEKII